jgi:hypothetical protein
MGSHMRVELDGNVIYVLNGISRDVETIIRLRPWIEDEIRSMYGDFSSTKLYTDYRPASETFEYKIVFYK